MHPKIKEVLGYRSGDPAARILTHWKRRVRHLCKPCRELKYFPYSTLVEQFPLPPLPDASAIEHQEHLKTFLKNGKLPDGRKLGRQGIVHSN